ncbi:MULTISPECIES: hypothetical protein [Paraburkholderia]|uniref:Uncharacterized protein n=1 Tax=Paraburkholderia madseniana TaxID=2599607 RepID=A0A6N6WHV7_9BURK|nr:MULTISPECIES: hypothetical protein [Paraburkholderia]KAE8759498.1 hypothetical protein FSO04_13335 [Paraburkholderia madseniana]MCX4151812.1 hypothetical protein [Paraburkholderia madseniana]MCX4177484.1 hypothetical protein [Paraburkholderia madseniana]MDN7154739.1 hypothetical protein [Paraburkholderia sp. WS6]MDQ6413622.1 hypothetical protein [Paraburkholderia madseniana]
MDVRVRRPVHPMPEMAAFIAELRSAFGDKAIDDAVSRGKSGEPAFYACENGTAVGTASPANDNVWHVSADIRDRHYCPGCDGGCVGQGLGCKEWLQRKADKEKA